MRRKEKLNLEIGQVLTLLELDDIVEAHVNNSELDSTLSDYPAEEVLEWGVYPFFYEETGGTAPPNNIYFDIIEDGKHEESVVKITRIDIY